MRSRIAVLYAALLSLVPLSAARAAGTLTPRGSADQPVRILDHHVEVLINNGFCRTEVTQTFFNPNPADVEAVYAFPIPQGACLSEMVILAGEDELHGEVVARERAREIYAEEQAGGSDAGLATRNGYQTFEFAIARVPAQAESSFRFVYYQQLELDTGIGRYVYPLEEGGTDEAALSFWSSNAKVDRSLSVRVELKSAWPVEKVRMPGLDAILQTEQKAPGHYVCAAELADGSLAQDLVFYYKLADDLPGRIEVIPYRAGPEGPGTFLMVVTPGVDLQPLQSGADHVFVLDTSGSMQGKIQTLVEGVCQTLGKMGARDRFRVIEFNDRAREVTPGWQEATPANVQQAVQAIRRLDADRGTDLHAGLELALRALDADRATSLVLVTDAVANQGEVSPAAFRRLLEQYDVRVFGFLLGNGANWPLMRLICETSGGFYAGVSHADDIIGQILLAKSKVLHECLHDARLEVTGVRTFETSGQSYRKVYRGQQLVMLGRYAGAGAATVTLRARLTGADRTYSTRFEFPEVDTRHPELERLWALDRVEDLEALLDRGELAASEGQQAIADLGVSYQLVTGETSMLVLSDAQFGRHGIERRNRDRVARERTAQAERHGQPVVNHRVDREQPAFDRPAAGPDKSGAGAFGIVELLLVGGLLVVLALARQERGDAASIGGQR